MKDLHRFSHPLGNTANNANGIYIKGCHNLVILLQEILVNKECASHVANTYNGNTPFPVNPKDFFDMELQFFDIISHATYTELSKVCEVLSHLGCIYVANLSKESARRYLLVF